MKKILLYSKVRNLRLEYITDFMFQGLLGWHIELTSNLEYFERAVGAKLNYSPRRLSTKSLWIVPHPLLQARNISPQEIIVRYENSTPFFFNTSAAADIGSDLLAASFYLLTRYEEYLDYEADEHRRFPASQSIAYRAGFLERPIIQEWAVLLREKLRALFPNLSPQSLAYRFQPTFDIDMAWAYRHKSWQRTLGAMSRDIVSLDFSTFKERLAVLLQMKADPFAVYEKLATKHAAYQLKPIFFFLLGNYDTYDKNIDAKHPSLQALIKDLHLDYDAGIHPSYASNTDIWQIRAEMERLEQITHRKPQKSRQHYLKLHLPATYQQLIKCGITDDYSMGYADAVGFRAGVGCAFKWYDLSRDEATDLVLHPFQLMDVTLKDYMQLSPQAASDKIEQLIRLTRQFGGTFIPLWHNSSFSAIGGWEAWEAVYDRMLAVSC